MPSQVPSISDLMYIIHRRDLLGPVVTFFEGLDDILSPPSPVPVPNQVWAGHTSAPRVSVLAALLPLRRSPRLSANAGVSASVETGALARLGANGEVAGLAAGSIRDMCVSVGEAILFGSSSRCCRLGRRVLEDDILSLDPHGLWIWHAVHGA